MVRSRYRRGSITAVHHEKPLYGEPTEPSPITPHKIAFVMPCCEETRLFISAPQPGTWINCPRCGAMKLPGGMKKPLRSGRTICCNEKLLDDGRCSMCLTADAKLWSSNHYMRGIQKRAAGE